MKHCIEPALKQIGNVVKEYSQSVYTAHKTFRIVQPNAIQEDKQVEINVPMYNDLGEAIGKWKDYASAKFDVKIVAGSTLPINRWAYLAELKELMGLGVVDDIAVLAETDIKNKESIVKRKSLYSQLKNQISNKDEEIKEKTGTIETLTRQLVQAGIKNKIMQGDVEVNKRTHDAKSSIYKEELESKAQMKHMRKEIDKEKQISDEQKNKSLEETNI